MPEEMGDVWSGIRPVESINIDWFKKHGYTPEDVKLFLEGVIGIVSEEKNELEKHRLGETILGIPIYVEWSHPMTAFVDNKNFIHYAVGTTQVWKPKKYVFVGEEFSRGMFGIEYYWVEEGSRWAEAVKKQEHLKE